MFFTFFNDVLYPFYFSISCHLSMMRMGAMGAPEEHLDHAEPRRSYSS